jgi:UDP-3-O-[3-hydroxymyristoyl] N-acetylglucosamine deacetylase
LYFPVFIDFRRIRIMYDELPMDYRQTIARPVSEVGIGLHSGKTIRLGLNPAAAGTGVVFVRTDLDGLEIPANLAHAGPSFYATVIGCQGETVSTIEHLMAAVYSMRVDDLRVELDGAEVPIFDGSSRRFVELLREAGVQDSDMEREYIHITRPIEVSHEDKRITVYPCREFQVSYAIDFDHPVLGYQELTACLWEADQFSRKLAPARTFAFEKDVEALKRKGLALGGSLENAVVIAENRILNPELRFTDEFVRHKMLDLTGDLSLLGYPLRGHVVAFRAGHDLHARLARKISESTGSWYLAPWKEDREAVGTAVGT